MLKHFKKILFATDLSDSCRHAFTYAASLAANFGGSITILHVLEEYSESLDGRLKALLGRDTWEMMQKKHENEARSFLIGKKSELTEIHNALNTFSQIAQNDECKYAVENIVIKDGNLVETILQTSREEEYDLIVMGSHKSILSGSSSLSSRARRIIKGAKIPVMMVPPPVK